jgi:hypothetical protein
MTLEARVEPLTGRVPSLRWNWDSETDILSGSFKQTGKAAGLTGTVELSDDIGSVAVLDVAGGVIRGIDVVVWPDVTSQAGLTAPAPSRDAMVLLPSRPSQPGIASLEMDTTLSMSTNPAQDLFHLRIGGRQSAEIIRIADRCLVELDHRHRLAGFWLLDVPPFPSAP